MLVLCTPKSLSMGPRLRVTVFTDLTFIVNRYIMYQQASLLCTCLLHLQEWRSNTCFLPSFLLNLLYPCLARNPSTWWYGQCLMWTSQYDVRICLKLFQLELRGRSINHLTVSTFWGWRWNIRVVRWVFMSLLRINVAYGNSHLLVEVWFIKHVTVQM